MFKENTMLKRSFKENERKNENIIHENETNHPSLMINTTDEVRKGR